MIPNKPIRFVILLRIFRHFLRTHPRLSFCIIAGLAGFAMLPPIFSLSSRIMIGWNIHTWIYIVSLWRLMLGANPDKIRFTARRQDESARTVLIMVCIACIVSLLVILLELSTARSLTGIEKIWHLGLTGITLLASWMLIPTAFALHYGHLFYLAPASDPPFMFPKPLSEPIYWDFLYISFTIAVANQTSDVSINNTNTRRLVLLQSVLSFIFNISILGLSVNVGASLLN